jgi:CHASE3 domain sensor protein
VTAVFVRRTLQIAAIGALVLLTALAAVTVRFYRQHRSQYKTDLARSANDFQDMKIRDALRNASDALRNSQIYAANYVLTGRADSLKAYRESLQDWQYESGTLKLLSDDGRTALLREFSPSGDKLESEMEAIVALYEAGKHDAALDRLRTGAAMAYGDKIEGMREAGLKAFSRGSGIHFYDSLEVSRRVIVCVGGVYLLAFLGFGLLLYFLRTTGSDSGSAASGWPWGGRSQSAGSGT